MDLQAITGQLYIIDGELRPADNVPGLLAQPAPKGADKNRRNDFLFVHLTLSPASAERQDLLSQELTEAIASTYYSTIGTTNTALRQSIRTANQLLLNWNINNSGQRREGAVSCAVMRKDELYVIQSGPSVAFMGHNFGIERLPAHEPEQNTPLGQSANIDFRFGHYRLQTGDMFLLAEPQMISVATAVMQPALVDTEVEIGLEELKDIVDTKSARIMLIEFNDDPPPEFPDTDLAITTLSQSSPRPKISRPAYPLRKQINLGGIETGARRGAAAAAMGASRLTEGVADILEYVIPTESELAAERGDEKQAGESWAIPTSVAFLVPILIALIITSLFLQRENNRRLSEIVQDMNFALGLASDEQDESIQRIYYLQVLQLGQEANQIRAQDNVVVDLMDDAREALDRLDNITRLHSQQLYRYEELPEEPNLISLALSNEVNGNIYVLDEANNRVMRHFIGEDFALTNLDVEPQEIIFSNRSIQAHQVGKMVDLMWRPRGASVSRDGVAVLDSRGALITFSPTFESLTAAPLGLSSGWREPSQIKGFNERLYILDSEAGFIWRYYPNDDQLTIQEGDQAIAFYDEIEVGQLVDFAINSSDGTVVVLYRDGRLMRYADGRAIWSENVLAEGGLLTPMLSPTAVKIVGRGSITSIFVLDSGSGRVLQFSFGGELLAQYRAADDLGQELFSQATDFEVIESPLRLFAVTPDSIYITSLQPIN